MPNNNAHASTHDQAVTCTSVPHASHVGWQWELGDRVFLKHKNKIGMITKKRGMGNYLVLDDNGSTHFAQSYQMQQIKE